MSTLKWILAVVLLGTFKVNAQGLKDYQWKNRVLLLFDKSQKSSALKSQLERFSEVREEMVERDLVLFTIADKVVFAQNGLPQDMRLKDVYDAAKVSGKFKGVVLIGKDGGAKLKKDFEVNPQLVFDLIDSMPMRRAEMRSKKN